ncbi:MAG: hypothetical protein HON70_37415, partial [Lentisphaerae bacterium]|nr:hypothetical protein [Lentisphaerota bacterium]
MAEWNTISLLSTALLVCGATAPADTKQHSVFFPQNLLDRARRNAEVHPREARLRDQLIADAQPWVALSDDALWHLMFGPNITRSWMVWSNGHCPSCSKNVPMYEWETDPLVHPWKVRCPQCDEFFPKNDFRSFYRSGLDEHNVFQPKKADRALLFNAEHPDPAHPLHGFGVDDGEGYVAGKDRWRFIGAYLIYGQWKQAVLGGIKRLAEAYVVTGDTAYAHKAGILLD